MNSNGQLKPEGVEPSDINRFSFRLAGAAGLWKKHDTQPPEILKSGDQVNIYCHSLGIGPYANIEKPPEIASVVLYSAHERKFSVDFDDHVNTSEIRTIIQQYDYGILQRRDQDAFERKGYLAPADRVGKIKPDKTLSALADRVMKLELEQKRLAGFISADAGPIGVAGPISVAGPVSVAGSISVAGVSASYVWEKVSTKEQLRHSTIKVGYEIATFTVLFE